MPQIFLIAAGGLFVILWILAAGVLIAPRTDLPLPVRFTSGAVLVSAAVFVVLIAHAGYLFVWLAIGTITIAFAIRRAHSLRFPAMEPMSWWFRALFACYGLVYLVYVFAPEIQPDAITYHLGLVYEYVRLHSLSSRVGFYELLPQGVEMLFVPAFAIGAHSAAKLVHFSFLAATLSIVRHVSRELGISGTKACCAAAIFLIAPVTAIDSTSAYTDAALVACCASLFYLTLRCKPLLAGLNAGFCYAIKPTFGWVTLAALTYFVIRSSSGKRNSAAWFSGAAAISILPWIIRSSILSLNPFAPFFNTWFPNASFTPQLEARLISSYSAFRPSFSWHNAILDYTVLGGNQGIFGPAFLFLPLALLALRTKPGRWLNAAALLLAIPVLTNTGTRFLMPAAAIASLALMSALPSAAAIALVAIQMIGSANPVIDLYDTRHDWRLHNIPLLAALRLENENDYLQENIEDFETNKMIVNATPENARVFVLANVQQAYLPREVLVYWQSALADRILDLLAWARESWGTPASLVSCTWPAGKYRTFRVTATSDIRVLDAQFNPGGLTARLNEGRSIRWTPLKAGQWFDLPSPPGVTGADLLIWPSARDLTYTQAQSLKGEWLPIEITVRRNTGTIDIRRDVTAFIRRSGYRYILIPEENSPFSFIGKDLLEHPGDWGVTPVTHQGDVWLFYISDNLRLTSPRP